MANGLAGVNDQALVTVRKCQRSLAPTSKPAAAAAWRPEAEAQCKRMRSKYISSGTLHCNEDAD